MIDERPYCDCPKCTAMKRTMDKLRADWEARGLPPGQIGPWVEVRPREIN